MTEKSENHEQRNFIRVPDSSGISYEVAFTGKTSKSQAKEISQSGIRFISEEKLPIGTVIDVSLTLEQLEFSFTAHATVRWTKEIVKNRRYEVGVKFEGLPEVTTKKLISYIQAVKRLDSYA
ncbi:MAG: PilZ domain-containing protein [Candidatus Aceula meridiana]|nr:PilZ domain-containing protein [Candidatus Aceula meridiana]